MLIGGRFEKLMHDVAETTFVADTVTNAQQQYNAQHHWDLRGHHWTKDCPSLATVEITLGDLVEYSEECYNDSSYGYFSKFGEGWIEYDPISKWVHRRPTFDGFIEWRMKRLK
jgi:hypothetical protein